MGKIAKYLKLAFWIAIPFYVCSCDLAEILASIENIEDWEKIPVTSSSLRVTGRADWSEKDQVSVSWSGSAFTIGFEGTSLKIFLEAPGNKFDVFVDGEAFPSSIIDRSIPYEDNNVITVVKDLPKGKHFVRIQKNTEAVLGTATLKGIFVEGKADSSALPARPQKKIEFIGNSILCGLGVLSHENDSVGIESEDHFYSYAGQAARLLDAEEHSECTSGKGIIRNFDGSTTQLFPELYDKLSFFKDTPWNTEEWTPDLVFINLGTNDFLSGIPDSATFVNGVINFVKQIRVNYPQAGITMLDGPMLVGESIKTCRKYLDAALEFFHQSGDMNVYRFTFETQGALGYGVANHPNVAQGLKDGTSLAEWVKKQFHWN